MIDFTTFNENYENPEISRKNKLILVASHIMSFGIGSMVMYLFMKNHMC